MFAIHRDDGSIGGNLPPCTVYFYRRTRAMEHVYSLLTRKLLIVHHDGHPIYSYLLRPDTPYAGIITMDCWPHVRRLFTNEIKAEKRAACPRNRRSDRKILRGLRNDQGKPPSARSAVRRRDSMPILERIKTRLHELKPRYLEKGDMGKAIRYVGKRWTGLTLFVDDGRIELDNNPVEQTFKHSVLLRKNMLFIGNEEGGWAWAIPSSLAQSCKVNNVDFYRLLMWVFGQIIENRKMLTIVPCFHGTCHSIVETIGRK